MKIVEGAKEDIIEQQINNRNSNITKEQLATILNKYFKTVEVTSIPDEISSTNDLELTTIDEKYSINLSAIYSGRFLPTKDDLEYSIGDYITINGERFYVIENSYTTQPSVKLLAAELISEETNKQIDTSILDQDKTYYKPFGSSTKTYANSTIKSIVEQYVSSLGITTINSRLLSYEDLVIMGYPYESFFDDNWNAAPEFLLDTASFWLMDGWSGEQNWVYVISGEVGIGLFQGDVFDAVEDSFGVRPVIEVLKVNLPN